MQESGVSLQALGKNFKAFLLASLLYPLQRIQSIQQVQSSYASPAFKNSKHIIAQAVHYGRRSYYRGLSTFMAKAALLTALVRGTSFFANHGLHAEILWVAISATGYLFFYPLEIINVRMSVEVERQRFFANVRTCVSKIKINQGVKTFYRGFGYSCLLFVGQIALLKQLMRRVEAAKSEFSAWQGMGLLLGSLAASELLLYPFNTIKKLYQVNGGLGHTDQNFSLRTTLRTTRLTALFRGLQTKMANLLAYTLLYCWWLAEQAKVE